VRAKVDLRNVACGALLIAAGLIVSYYGYTAHNIGTLRQMGTGMFPFVLGLMLACLGLVIALLALIQRSEGGDVEVRPFLAVFAGLIAFPFLLPLFGIVPAASATAFVSSFAVSRLGLAGKLVLAAVLGVLIYLIFILALGLPFVAFRMPR